MGTCRYADVVVHRQLLQALSGAPEPPLPHAELAAAARTMNLRHRQSKAVQKQCSEMYLLLHITRTQPVEQAIVRFRYMP